VDSGRGEGRAAAPCASPAGGAGGWRADAVRAHCGAPEDCGAVARTGGRGEGELAKNTITRIETAHAFAPACHRYADGMAADADVEGFLGRRGTLPGRRVAGP